MVAPTQEPLPAPPAADIARIEAALGPLPAVRLPPSLMVVVGLPGSGKSFFCRSLVACTPLVRLESDALRQLLFGQPTYSAEESQRLFAAIHAVIERLLAAGCSMVLDATNLRERHRRILYDIAARHSARLLLVRVWAPPAVVRQRLEERVRQRHPDDRSEADYAVYLRLRQHVEPLRQPHITVDTSEELAGIVQLLAREIESL